MNAEDPVKILLVDDNEAGLIALGAVLNSPSYWLTKVRSGPEALECLQKHSYAAVLLDVQMPGMNGFETAKTMRENEWGKNVPIIFITAIDKDVNYVHAGYDMGAVDYISKPFDPHILRSKVAVFARLYEVTATLRLQSQLLSVSEARYRLLLESAKDHAIFMLDLDGRVNSWNSGAEQIYGYNKDEVLGQPYAQLCLPGDVESGKPAKLLEVARQHGRAHSEGWRVRDDGSRFYADVVISTIKDELGAVIGFCKVTRDMTQRKMEEEALKSANDLLESRVKERTSQLSESNSELKSEMVERKQTQWALQESENRFRMMVDTVPALVWMSGGDGRLNFFNKGWFDFTGQELEVAMNDGWMKWIHPEDASLFADAYDQALRKRKVFTAEYRFRRFNGEYRWVLNTGVPRFSLEGVFMGYTGLAVDITNRKMAEEILLKSEMLQREFVANVSHDFRTPVATIKGFAETLRRGAIYDSKNSMDFVKTIERHAERLEMLVEDLLTISALESGKIQAQYEDINLHDFVAELIKSMTFLIKRKNISVRINVAPDVFIWADPAQLHKLFQNLLTNAFKYNRSGGWVEISAEISGDKVKISVKDNGIGISEKHLPRVFERFYRADKNRQREAGDTGLGLHIVKQIVESTGGGISVESAENVGSTFNFILPRYWPQSISMDKARVQEAAIFRSGSAA